MIVKEARPPDAAVGTSHNIPDSRAALAAPDPWARAAAGSFLARFTLWRLELLERIFRRLSNDPGADVGYDRYLLGIVDQTIAALEPRP